METRVESFIDILRYQKKGATLAPETKRDAVNPLHTDGELRFDGDWFYWKTDEGSVLPCRITVE